jgi:exopolysaccharide biosynthesis predicted pyruvyltransferase EpsI
MSQGLLDQLQGRSVYFDPLHGNHGDRLIALGAERLLQEADVQRVSGPSQAQVILLNGGGAMTEGWFGLKRLAKYNRSFPHTPLVVWPSSFHFPDTDLASLFAHRRSPAWLWARDRVSLQLLQAVRFPPTVQLGLEHDLALSLRNEPFFESLSSQTARAEVLIVERDDWEGATGRTRPLALPGLELVPQKLRSAVRRKLLGRQRQRQDSSPFAQTCLALVRERHAELGDLTPVVGDVSLPEVCDFQEFLNRVAGATVIITTRLHVAILGFMLARTTYLVEGTYHKCRGVYEHSLQGGTVQLVRWCRESHRLTDQPSAPDAAR